jgi:ribonuclease D
MSTPEPRLLTAPADLATFANRIAAAGRVALDTEFVWERTYRPALAVVQLAVDDECVLVDPLALEDLSPLFPALQDPAVPVIVHGGGQDLEIMAQMMGTPMRGVVDTQVVAAYLGYGAQVGLGALLERVLKVRIKKTQTYSDWTRRPLTPAQLAYALVDVAHLLDLWDRMRAEIEERERLAWVEEELHELEDPARYAPPPDTDRYQWVKGWQRLDGQDLAVLRSLAAWRERAARRANVRPNLMLNDIVLTTMAGHPPTTLDELRQVRGMSGGNVERHGRDLLAAIAEGQACPRDQWPAAPERSRSQPSGLLALLRTALQTVAARHRIAAEVIANGRDLEALAAASRGSAEPDLAVLRGWRRELVGETLCAIARGEVAIRYDPARKQVIIARDGA